MSKIIIEYDTEELKSLIIELLVERLLKSMQVGDKQMIVSNAKKIAQQRLSDEIEKELRLA